VRTFSGPAIRPRRRRHTGRSTRRSRSGEKARAVPEAMTTRTGDELRAELRRLRGEVRRLDEEKRELEKRIAHFQREMEQLRAKIPRGISTS